MNGETPVEVNINIRIIFTSFVRGTINIPFRNLFQTVFSLFDKQGGEIKIRLTGY